MANPVIGWHNNRVADHHAKHDAQARAGWRLVSLSLHGTEADRRITAVMVLRGAGAPVQHHHPILSAAQLDSVLAAEAAMGFGAVILAAAGSAQAPDFSAVFEPLGPVPPVVRPSLPLGDAQTPESLLGRHALAHAQGLMPRWLSAYGSAAAPRYAGIWVPNTGRVVWNGDGTQDTAAQYQERFDAYVSWACRAALVSPTEARRQASVFVHSDVGRAASRHNLTGAQYQAAFDQHVGKDGLVPVCVQAAGGGAATRYAALFVEHEVPRTEQFRSQGPVAHPVIDELIERFMRESPLWRVGVSVVHGSKLVYARGYSYGEPHWPDATPSTAFRIASVSKVFTAVALYRAIERLGPGVVTLDSRVQDILALRTPAGKPPADPRFATITLRQLLDHTSGLEANAHRNDAAILKLHNLGRLPSLRLRLPVTPEMCDAYIASLKLSAAPGSTKGYNNAGYYLLGRVVARLYGQPTVMQAFAQQLLAPMSMAHTRAAEPLMSAQKADDARCRGGLDDSAGAIALVRSVMDDAQGLVPGDYGDMALQRMEGTGGLAASPVDLARLMTVWTAGTDTPVLKAATAAQMLQNAAANVEAWAPGNPAGRMTGDNRAGHGFDRVAARAGGRWMGYKGGALTHAACWYTVDGPWGLAISLAGNPNAALLNEKVGTSQLTLLPAVKKALDGLPDLFPQFGLPAG